MKAQESATVHLVVVPDYSESIRLIPHSEVAWVVNTPENGRAIEQVAAKGRNLIAFNPLAGKSPEELVISALEPIHVHHPSPPFSQLNVIGAVVSSDLQAELHDYGFIGVEETSDGFRAYKDAPKS